MNRLKIPKYGEHCTFLGETGSGKTMLAVKLLQRYKRYFIFDTQDSLDLEGYIATDPLKAVKALRADEPRIIYRPNKVDYFDLEVNEYILRELIDSTSSKNKKPRIVYIDEIFHLGYNQSFPRSLPVGFAVGRQRGISFWVSTQRPRLIPTNILSQSTYIYIFSLSDDSDVKRISEFVKYDKKEFIQAVNNLVKSEYRFILIDKNKSTWRKYPPIRI